MTRRTQTLHWHVVWHLHSHRFLERVVGHDRSRVHLYSAYLCHTESVSHHAVGWVMQFELAESFIFIVD